MNANKKNQNAERDRIPATVEDTIPIQKIFEDGIMLVGRNLWAKTFRFTDINYEVASKEDKEAMFFSYSDIINLFDEKASTKITIRNRHIPRSEFEAENMMPLEGDELDRYRREYNGNLERNVILTSGVEQDKYLTVTVEKPSVAEARTYFNGKCAEYTAAFSKLGSKLTEVEEKEKIRIFYDFFHRGREDDFMYDRLLYKRRKHKFKLALAPESMEFKSDHFKMDGRYGRVLYLKDYANFIKDSLISELTAIDRNMMLSIDAEPIPQEKAVRQGENKLLAVETNISNWQRTQNQNNNYSATVPYEMERQRDESRDFLNDLVERDMRMIPTLITIVHTADSKAQLDADTESIQQCARKHLCSLAILRWQQLEGLKTCLPYGGTKLTIRRTLTTESLAVFMPFRAQEVCHKNGLYLGNNAISKNMIMANRLELLNGNSFITGVSGSGKSIMAKQEIVNLYLSDKDADIIVIDPEREYLKLTEALGGENVTLSSTSKNHINALQINKDYADGANPVTLKSEFVLSLCEQAMNGRLSASEKSLIDRCTSIVLRDYVQNGYTGEPPTLKDFREVLLKQSEPEAADIALAIELFTEGSLNTFAKQTNVNTQSRLICYTITLTDKLGNKAEVSFTIVEPVVKAYSYNFDKMEDFEKVLVNGEEARLNYGTLELTAEGVYEIGVVVNGKTYTYKVTVDNSVSFAANVHNGGFANSVKFTANEGVSVTVTKNGEAYAYEFGKEITEPATYKATVTDAIGNKRELTFTVIESEVGKFEEEIDKIEGYEKVFVNGVETTIEKGTLALTESGTYEVAIVAGGVTNKFTVTVDATAPTLTLNGVENDGTTTDIVTLTDLTEEATVKVFFNDEEIEYELGSEFSEIGSYKVVVDDGFNTTEYSFVIEKGANIALIVILIILGLGAAGTAVFFYFKKKNSI